MRVAFRTDASVQIGIGHLMRCLTLADALKANGAECVFVCRQHVGNLLSTIKECGYSALVLPLPQETVDDVLADRYELWLGADWRTDAAETFKLLMQDPVDWLVVDHYALDIKWEKRLRAVCNKLMVIDDLANRLHDCDLLLDQNYYKNAAVRYDALVPEAAMLLLGPDYMLLRPEFYEARGILRERNGEVRRILVFFGGGDPTNQTLSALEGIGSLGCQNIYVDVVVGSANPFKHEIYSFCENTKWANYHYQVSNMAELISSADIGIGAGGSAMWERCALGLPTLTVVFAENQVKATEDVAKTGAIIYIGSVNDLTSNDYAQAVQKLLNSPEDILSISNNAVGLIDMNCSGATKVLNSMSVIENSRE